MRIIVTFIIGFLVFFFLGEILSQTKRKFSLINKILPLAHSIPGVIFFILGLTEAALFFNNPTQFLSGIFLAGAGLGLIVHHFLSKQYILSEKIEKDFYRRHDTAFERMLEILPGALLWIALTSPLWLSFALPFAVAYLILLADAYWLFNAFKVGILIFLGYKKMEWAKSQDWLGKLKEDFPDEWQSQYHLILVPTYKESLKVLGPTFDAIIDSEFPKDKILMVVGYEERDSQEKIDATNQYLKEHVEGKIGKVFITNHPFGLEGEVPGQGSNKNWMINQTVPQLKKLGIKLDQVLVTTLDADFAIHSKFLAGALHKYLSTPKELRLKRSYTGTFLYYNNYWQTPTPMRLMAVGCSLWQLAEMVGSDKYINYSSMSMNLQGLLDVDLWIPDKVNDDSGFYWKTYFKLKGDYKVLPHFLPISGDAVQDESFLKTLQNQYLQIKRWAYGVEHTPMVVKQYFKQDISFWDKTDKLIFFLWGYLKWGFMALFISFGGMLIPLINPNYKASAVSVNLPIVSSWILTAAFVGLFATIYVHEKTVPPRPKEWSLLRKFWTYIHWTLMPIILVTISTIPAIDAQTTLMFGKHLEFRVTNKARQ